MDGPPPSMSDFELSGSDVDVAELPTLSEPTIDERFQVRAAEVAAAPAARFDEPSSSRADGWLGEDAVAELVRQSSLPAALHTNRGAVLAGLTSLCSSADTGSDRRGLRTSYYSVGSSVPDAIAAGGGVTLACTVLRGARADDAELLERAASLLDSLSSCDRAVEQLGETVNMATLVKCLNGALAHAKVLEHCCNALRNACLNVDDARRVAAECQAIDAVVKAMEVHPTDPDLVAAACRALRSVCERSANVPYVIIKGGLSAVVGGVKACVTSAPAVRAGCGLVLYLSEWRAASGMLRSATDAMVRCGVVPLLLSALQRHILHEDICNTASQALLKLSEDDRGWHALTSIPDFADTLASILHSRPDTGTLQAQVGAVFTKLVRERPVNADTRALVAGSGCTMAVIALMQAVQTNIDVQTWGCDQLMALGFHGSHRARIARQEGVHAIVAAMERFPAVEPLQEAAVGALWVLCFHGDNRTVLGSLDGALGLVMTAQSTFSDNSKVLERIQALLFLLKA